MSGSTLGTLFCVTTFGESHGPAIGCVVDGCPPGLELSEADIQPDLDRRRPGTSRHVTQRKEEDKVEILSGVFEGCTTGTPIALLIRNTDQRSKDYANLLDTFRPGHADYTYHHKYGRRDPRGGGRASARLTAPAVGAAAIAKKWLRERCGTTFFGHLAAIGDIAIPFEGWEHVASNPFFAANASDIARIEAYVDELRKQGDSCGARVDVVARGVRIELVGLIASETVMSWPVEMPPSTPPALLLANPAGVSSSPCAEPHCAIEPKPAPISTPLTALIPIIAWAMSASSLS